MLAGEGAGDDGLAPAPDRPTGGHVPAISPAPRLAHVIALALALALACVLALTLLASQSLARVAGSSCSSPTAAGARTHRSSCGHAARPGKGHGHKKHHHHKPKKTKAKSKAKHAQALASVPATCEDGSEPARTGTSSFSCSDGSQPECEDGSNPTLSSGGSTLQCSVPVVAGASASEAGCEDEASQSCTTTSEEFPEANCADGSEPSSSEGAQYFCLDGTEPTCEDGSAPTSVGEGLPPLCDLGEDLSES
jgi:hypothetical protein